MRHSVMARHGNMCLYHAIPATCGIQCCCFASQETRARWNSIDGVLIFGWSGSALLGGILVDSIGFGSTFCITALMQGIGVCILIPLAFLVPRRENATLASGNDATAILTSAAEAGTSLGIADTDVEMPIEAPAALSAEAADLQQPLLQGQRSNQETGRGLSRE